MITMRKLRKYISVTLALMLVVTGCGNKTVKQKQRDSVKSVINSVQTPEKEPTEVTTTEEAGGYTEEDLQIQVEFENFMTETFYDEMESDYVNMHFTLEDPSKYNLEIPEVNWGSYGMDDISDYTEIIELKEDILVYEYDSLTRQQQYLRDNIVSYLDYQLAFEGLEYFDNPFGSMSGDASNLVTNLTEFRIANIDDAKAYIALIVDTKNYMDYLCEFADYRLEHGVSLPDFAIDNSLEQLTQYLEKMTEENPIIIVFDQKVDALDIPDEEKIALKAEARTAFEDYFMPGYQQLYNKIDSLRGTCTVEGGLSNYENGKEYYTALAQLKTSSEYTPDELAAILDEFLDEQMTQMYALMLKDASIYEEYENHASYYTESDATIILNGLAEFAKAEFPEIPEVGFEVSPLDKSLEVEGQLAYYLQHPYDNLNQNVIRTNSSALADDLAGLYSTLAHEGFPGHLYHFVYQGSRDLNPMAYVMNNYLGCVEGWARYIEGKAITYHLDNDNLAKLITIDTNYSYALMGRVDIGVNYEGWTLEDLENYMIGLNLGSDGAQELYEIMVEEPAVYLPYAVGPVFYLNLEEKAMEELGSDFVQKEFYEAVLEPGFCTYENMEQSVNEYIERKQMS